MEQQNNNFGSQEQWRFNPLTGEPLYKGLENWKRLFKKPSLTDWITLFVIVMALIGAYMYNAEVKACHETLNNLDKVCLDRATNGLQGDGGSPKLVANLTNVSLNEPDSGS